MFTESAISNRSRYSPRVEGCALTASVKASQELFAHARTPTFIPTVGFKDIPLDFWREIQFNGHIGCELGAEVLPTRALSLDC